MTLQDINHGLDWMMWGDAAFLALISIILLTGHGSRLIAGFYTSSKEEKSKYDEKKICKVTGIGVSVLAVFVLIMAIWQSILPAEFIYVFFTFTFIDCSVVIVLINTVCKK